MKSNLNATLYHFSFATARVIQYALFIFLDLFRPVLKIIVTKSFRDHFGITLNGDGDLDIKVNDEKAFAFILSYGVSGFAGCFIEKYMECKDFEAMMCKIAESKYAKNIYRCDIWSRLYGFINKTFDIQTVENAKSDGGEHYDQFGEALKAISGPNLLHSCCNFDKTNDLAEGEIDQLKYITSKLQLKPGMSVLDIGCGFGTLAQYLGSNFDVTVTGVTISSLMANTSKERCKQLSNVSIIESDYRLISGKYDRITCIEMIEHIGDHHYTEFFSKINDLLVDDGLFMLQVVSTNQRFMFEYNPIFADYLGMRITFPKIAKVIDKSSDFFVMEHMRNIGYNYGETSSKLYHNIFTNWHKFADSFDSRIVRLLLVYGGSGTAMFKYRYMHNNQIVFSKGIKYQYNCNE